jgi:CheY-like chemotaxis protein
MPRIALLIEDYGPFALAVTDLIEGHTGLRHKPGNQDRWQVVRVSTLADGVEALKSQPIDLVLLDFGLPDALNDASTIEILQHARPEHQVVPIIALTGHESADTRAYTLALGLLGFVGKNELTQNPNALMPLMEQCYRETKKLLGANG